MSNKRTLVFVPASDTVKLDTLSLVPGSLDLITSEGTMDRSLYEVWPQTATVVFVSGISRDSITASYRVFPLDFSATYQRYDTTLIRSESQYQNNPYTYRPRREAEDIFGSTTLDKSGSISRGVGFGNNQDLTVNTSLSLQLNGMLTDKINVLASVSDDNIPIQPEGNTAQLQEFDKVFIKLYDDRSALTAGDFVIEKPVGFFTRYYKKAQGASFETHRPLRPEGSASFFTQTSAALSRGKFARNLISADEGNQGPYRLRGNEDEPFIIVLAGTERVFVDGREMQRGRDRDYVIDYNAAEITFTTAVPMNKDKRIAVEFQYSDASYARSLVQTSTGIKDENYSIYVNFYSEQDAKNQPLQQDLDDADRRILAEAGDETASAVAPGYTSVGEYTNDVVLYALRDSLGYDTVFVRVTEDVPNLYRVVFSRVGDGQGDYIQSGFDATGRIYEWVAPDTVAGQVVRAGDHAPVRLLTAPRKNQMLMAGATYAFSDRTEAAVEVGFSNADANTFSNIGNDDNYSPALMARFGHRLPLSDKPKAALLSAKADLEWIGSNFQPIEPYRSVEFNRDWNLPVDLPRTAQLITGASLGFAKPEVIEAVYGIRYFNAGDVYRAAKNNLTAHGNVLGFTADIEGSILDTRGVSKSHFVRHKSKVEKPLLFAKLGFADEREENRRNETQADSLSAASYRFYDWQFYITERDSSKFGYKLYYRERSDFAMGAERFVEATHAEEYGAELSLTQSAHHQLTARASNRRLDITNRELSVAQPENTLLLRVDHTLRLWKNALTTSTFYEIGSGLERRQEFIYVQDPTGQGPFTWIDYNGNDIKELNEFEEARPEDGDRYIRVFTPTDNYERIYSNKYSQSLNLNPAGLWSDKKGLLRFLARFANQTAFRVERKTRREDDADRFNPFLVELRDSILVSRLSTFRNTLSFNRSDPVYGLDYGYAQLFSKTPLTTGFEERTSTTHTLRERVTLSRAFAVELEQELGKRQSVSDVLLGRTFDIGHHRLKQTLSYRRGTDLRLALSAEYTDKANSPDLGGETAILFDLGIDFRLSKPETGTLFAKFNAINIDFNGMANNSLAYEMLDGLQDGKNFTWGAGVQRALGKNLRLNLSYNGRKSQDTKSVHTGNVEVRAFF